ncbi:hypothetical protein [Candidatus Lokiarchaeum ossiferum]|uniref:hypothetical protein n=1 Tax=Candidatus Lokiarchaeum ossiferum TaxID=2951803 RepID=UPI00352C6C1F
MSIESKIKISPKFKLNPEKKVECKNHSKKFDEKTDVSKVFKEKESNCLNCEHYKNNNCEIPSLKIKKIAKNKNKVFCDFCGERIDSVNSLVYVDYLESKNNVKIPLLCCTCFKALENNKISVAFENLKKRKIYEDLLVSGALLIGNIVFLVIIINGAILNQSLKLIGWFLLLGGFGVFFYLLKWLLETLKYIKKLGRSKEKFKNLYGLE